MKTILNSTECRSVFSGLVLLFLALTAQANENLLIDKWLDQEFNVSSISREAQVNELKWFIEAAKPFQGMTINVQSETLKTHQYEADVIAIAFSELTGIKVKHELVQEADVIKQLWVQMLSGLNKYDMFVNDSDLIGTHSRSGEILELTDFMQGAGKEVTLPSLDIDDFIGKSFVTGIDGKMYQLPDQQFANLYWFRLDWFENPVYKLKFKSIYGYELGVPVNWSAYEDIADFFTNDVAMIDNNRIYGHMDYGKRDPSLGWRFTDAWLSMAGTGDAGIPNGKPVDEWGIRMEGCNPVGSSTSRGGATNAPASVYALSKYIDWIKKYAPPEALDMTFGEAGSVPAQGQIAQQIFWYTAFTSDMIEPGLPVVNKDGTPKWRMAPSPHGAYWKEGMKLGYQDAGSWTIPKYMNEERQKAAWLYAQFAVSKTVSLKKLMVGLTPIRLSDIESDEMTKLAPTLGGLVEFYRSPARVAWTPTGVNVSDYPRLSKLWWPNIADAVTGDKTPQQAMDSLAKQQDRIMKIMQRNFQFDECGPQLAMADEVKGKKYWLKQPGSPKAKLNNEKPKGVTVNYYDLLDAWKAGKVR